MKKQTLVVDNNQNSFYKVSAALEQERVELFCAKTVSEALNSFNTHDFWLVFIDIHLPWREKLELVRTMKAIKVVPIIVFSGPMSKTNLKEMFQAGASIILKRPVDYEILSLQTHNFIELYSEIIVSGNNFCAYK